MSKRFFIWIWMKDWFWFNTATLSASESANLSTLFDVGGIAGAIVAGMLSDYSGMSALTCTAMLALAVPTVSSFSDNEKTYLLLRNLEFRL